MKSNNRPAYAETSVGVADIHSTCAGRQRCERKSEPPLEKKWLYFIASSLFPFYSFIQMNFLNTFSIYLTQHLELSHSQLGFLSAIFIYADAFLLLLVGILLDRFPVRALLLCGTFLSVFGALLFASSKQLPVLCLGRAISGAGHAFALLGCFRVVSLLFPKEKQGFFISMVITIALLGGLIAQTPLTVLIQHIGWVSALWVNVMLGVVLLFFLIVFLPKEKTYFIKINTNLWKNLAIVAKNIQNWMCGLYVCLLALPLMLLGAVWGSAYLVSAKHLSISAASWVSSSIFLGTLIGSPFFGWLSDKLLMRRLPMIIGALLSILCMSAITMSNQLPIYAYFSLFFILSFCASAQVLAYPVVNECNPELNRNTAMGLTNVIIMGSIATFQVIFGWFWANPILHPYTIYILTGALIVGLVLSIFIKETL